MSLLSNLSPVSRAYCDIHDCYLVLIFEGPTLNLCYSNCFFHLCVSSDLRALYVRSLFLTSLISDNWNYGLCSYSLWFDCQSFMCNVPAILSGHAGRAHRQQYDPWKNRSSCNLDKPKLDSFAKYTPKGYNYNTLAVELTWEPPSVEYHCWSLSPSSGPSGIKIFNPGIFRDGILPNPGIFRDGIYHYKKWKTSMTILATLAIFGERAF